MHKFTVEGVTVTTKHVILSGVWDFGVTKRYEALYVPIDLFVADSVVEALCYEHNVRKDRYKSQEEWQGFLDFG